MNVWERGEYDHNLNDYASGGQMDYDKDAFEDMGVNNGRN